MKETPARTRAERVRDTRALLATGGDCWVATASGGVPHLVPLSYEWHEGVIAMATPGRFRTVTNLAENPHVKLAFGTLHDVVVMDGTAEVRDLSEITDAALDRFAEHAGWDPRNSEGNVLIEVAPRRVLAWRRENELAGRVLMRGGEWLESEEGET